MRIPDDIMLELDNYNEKGGDDNYTNIFKFAEDVRILEERRLK